MTSTKTARAIAFRVLYALLAFGSLVMAAAAPGDSPW